jgi:hypothetical protein
VCPRDRCGSWTARATGVRSRDRECLLSIHGEIHPHQGNRSRWFAPGRTSRGAFGHATVKAYGFRGKEIDGVSKSHPDGQWVEGKIAGPQPGGRVQFEGLRPTGARVERWRRLRLRARRRRGDDHREKEIKVAQFIDVASLRKAVGCSTGDSRLAPAHIIVHMVLAGYVANVSLWFVYLASRLTCKSSKLVGVECARMVLIQNVAAFEASICRRVCFNIHQFVQPLFVGFRCPRLATTVAGFASEYPAGLNRNPHASGGCSNIAAEV